MKNIRKLKHLLVISFALFVIELSAAYLSNSLSLLSDSFHLLSDNLSIILSFLALKFSARPPSLRATFGYQKLGLLLTSFNGIFLLVSAVFIFYQFIERFQNPPMVDLKLMLPVALFGLLANIIMLRIIHHHREDFHIKSAWLHILGDTLSSVFVVSSGILILFTGFSHFDTYASLFILVLLLSGGLKVIRSSLRVFLDLAPPNIDLSVVLQKLKEDPRVVDLHDVHLWSIGHGVHAFTAHVRIADQSLSSADKIRRELEAYLRSYGISHIVLQMEALPCEGATELCAHIHRTKEDKEWKA